MDNERVVVPPLDVSLVTGPRPASELTVPIRAGRHVLAVALGMPDPRLASFRFPAGEMAAFLRISAADGTTQRVSNAGWKSSPKVARGWQRVEFDDDDWDSALAVHEPRCEPWAKQPAILLRRPF